MGIFFSWLRPVAEPGNYCKCQKFAGCDGSVGFKFARDFVLLGFNDFAIKLNQATALRTNQMIVMLMVVTMLITGVSVSKAFLPRESAFCQKLKRAVHSVKPTEGSTVLTKVYSSSALECPSVRKKNLQNFFALRSPFKSSLSQVIEENYLFLLHYALPNQLK